VTLSLVLVAFILVSSMAFCAEKERYITSDPVISVVDGFFNAVAAKDFKTAYYLKSECWRKWNDMEYFTRCWDNNNAIKLVDRFTYKSSECKAVVKVRVYTEDYDCCGKLNKRYHSGQIYLVYEKCRRAWKIDKCALTEETNGVNFGVW